LAKSVDCGGCVAQDYTLPLSANQLVSIRGVDGHLSCSG
jgi:hypothetical protein